jgi:hypothetical protein
MMAAPTRAEKVKVAEFSKLLPPAVLLMPLPDSLRSLVRGEEAWSPVTDDEEVVMADPEEDASVFLRAPRRTAAFPSKPS